MNTENNKYLKNKAYYEDLYDRGTVEQCRNLEIPVASLEKEGENLRPIKEQWHKVYTEVALYFLTGERYVNKEATIGKWIEQDNQRDKLYENTPAPSGVMCRICARGMELFDKDLRFDFERKIDRVLFTYRCADCRVGKYIYNNGEELDIVPWQCPECKRELKITSKRIGKKIKTDKKCVFCGYIDSYVLNLREAAEKIDPEKEKQFQKDRLRFCISDKEGTEYIQQKFNMEGLDRLLKKHQAEANNPSPKLEILTLAQVEKILNELCQKHAYVRLTFDKPDLARSVIVGFSVQDTHDRRAYDSRKQLKKIIGQVLENTNWKLMSEGLNYRLGILSGRLRGAEDHNL